MTDDDRETPRLSPSIGHLLTTESPLSAWAAHRLLGNFKRPTTDAQMEGRLWHSALLEAGKGIEVIEADNYRTKAAQEFRDAAVMAGRIPVLAAKFDEMSHGVTMIRDQLSRFGIVFDGTPEERFEWEEIADNGQPVACSGFIDHYSGSVITDLKTSRTPTTLHGAAREIAGSHALLQEPAYRRALADTYDLDFERISFVFAFVQTQEPFTVTPVTLSGEFREVAYLRWRRAINTWHECLSRGPERKCWPGPVEVTTPIHAPGWMLAQEIELEAMK